MSFMLLRSGGTNGVRPVPSFWWFMHLQLTKFPSGSPVETFSARNASMNVLHSNFGRTLPYISRIQLLFPPTWFLSESFAFGLKIMGMIYPAFSYTLAPTAKQGSTKPRQFALNSPLCYVASVKPFVVLDPRM